MRTMYDAVTAANIPADARMVAGYIDKIKLQPWSAADWARFPTAVKVTIVKKASTNDGHVLDVEPGDATPAQAPGWVRMRRAAGADPTVYMNLSTWPTVRQAFIDQGVAQPHYWVALYDGDPAWRAGWAELGCVAKQYAGDVDRKYDLSSVADHWPGVDGGTEMELGDKVNMWKGTVPAQYSVEQCLASAVGWGDTLGKRVDGLTASLGNLTQLVLKGADVDETALATALTPAITAAIAAKDFTEHTPEETAAAVKAMLRDTFGGGVQ